MTKEELGSVLDLIDEKSIEQELTSEENKMVKDIIIKMESDSDEDYSDVDENGGEIEFKLISGGGQLTKIDLENLREVKTESYGYVWDEEVDEETDEETEREFNTYELKYFYETFYKSGYVFLGHSGGEGQYE